MKKMLPLIVLLFHLSVVYSNSYSLHYYFTTSSAPGYGLPEFSIVGYVNDREIVYYSSDSGILQPRVHWMKKAEPAYWQIETKKSKNNEVVLRHNLQTAMSIFNHTGGFHYYQVMHGCELRDDGTVTGFLRYGYDGREFMFLDTQTWTLIPQMPQAENISRRANSPDLLIGEIYRIYLENECIGLLKNHIEDGREDLERRVQPKVKVTGQEKSGMTTLHCLVYRFYPRQVEVKWMKNGVDDVPSYEFPQILPNLDGTYQIKVSVEVIPKEEDSYSCYVDHSSLKEPLNIVWERTDNHRTTNTPDTSVEFPNNEHTA
ncbi:hypothetical protein GDO81_003336 [Engystomops pustulosus]|uniref:Ig-like domain-containing protein n=1 Tax=Engystomops pustulosus TaxID=76066 RepID=A0AAV7A2U5_ENGPU|nr:hypothetical protein GDO81_003336 [Engystomops pustulosus]